MAKDFSEKKQQWHKAVIAKTFAFVPKAITRAWGLATRFQPYLRKREKQK